MATTTRCCRTTTPRSPRAAPWRRSPIGQGQGADAVHDRARSARPARSGRATSRAAARRAVAPESEGQGEEGEVACRPSSSRSWPSWSSGRRRRGLGARDEVRRLPPAAARRRRQGHAQDPQGPRLDGEIPGDRRRRRAAARLHDRRRGRAPSTRTARPTSRRCRRRSRRRDRRPGVLRLRSAVRRGRGSARLAAGRAQGAAAGAAVGG